MKMRWGNLLLTVLCIVLSFILFAAGAEQTGMFVLFGFSMLLLYSLLASWISLNGCRIERILSSTSVASGHGVEISVTMSRRFRWPLPWLEIRDHWSQEGTDRLLTTSRLLFPWFRSSMTYHYRLNGLQRGIYRLERIEAVCGDLFGLSARTCHIITDDLLTVFPSPLEKGISNSNGTGWKEAVSLFPGRPASELSQQVREYEPGDPLNRIHWKATAKSGELKIREVEAAVSDKLLIYIDGTDAADKFLFETRIRLAAGIYRENQGAFAAIELVCGQASITADQAGMSDWGLVGGWFARLQPEPGEQTEEWVHACLREGAVKSLICISSSVDERMVRKLRMVGSRKRLATFIYVPPLTHQTLHAPWLDLLAASGCRIVKVEAEAPNGEVKLHAESLADSCGA